MFIKLLQKLRRHELSRICRNEKHGHIWFYNEQSERVAIVEQYKQLVGINLTTLEVIPLADIMIPASHKQESFCMCPEYYQRAGKEVQAVVAFMQRMDYSAHATTLIARVGNDSWVVDKTSCDVPGLVKLLTHTGKRVFIPLGALDYLPGLLPFHRYAMMGIHHTSGIPINAGPHYPIIQFRRTSDVSGAYTRTEELNGFPGVSDVTNFEVTLDVARVYNSPEAVIDLSEFFDAIRVGVEHQGHPYSIDVSKVKLVLGHNPLPITVQELYDTQTEWRVIMSKRPDGGVLNKVRYTNFEGLASYYP